MRADPTRPDLAGPDPVYRIGGENGTTPAWYVVRSEPDGVLSFATLLVADDLDRQLIADGARLRLTLYGAEVPWRVDVVPS